MANHSERAVEIMKVGRRLTGRMFNEGEVRVINDVQPGEIGEAEDEDDEAEAEGGIPDSPLEAIPGSREDVEEADADFDLGDPERDVGPALEQVCHHAGANLDAEVLVEVFGTAGLTLQDIEGV